MIIQLTVAGDYYESDGTLSETMENGTVLEVPVTSLRGFFDLPKKFGYPIELYSDGGEVKGFILTVW